MAEEKSVRTKPGKGLFGRPADLSLRGDINAACEAGLEIMDYRLKQQMQTRSLEWTRQNYIDFHWRGELPDECNEGALPDGLQDWSAYPQLRKYADFAAMIALPPVT